MGEVLVTGASGFTGVNLVNTLVERGEIVHVLLHNKRRIQSKIFPASVINHNYDGTYESLLNIFRNGKIEILCHLAAKSGRWHLIQDVGNLFASSLVLSAQLLEAAVTHGCRQAIIAGSYWQHAYGDQRLVPNSLYAVSKIGSGYVANYYSNFWDLDAIELVLFDSYGPGDSRGKILDQVDKAAQAGKSLQLTKGEQKIYPIHIDDVIKAFVSAIARLRLDRGKASTTRYYIPGPKAFTLREMVELYCKFHRLNVNLMWGMLPYERGQIMNPYVGRLLPDWYPLISIKDGFSALNYKSNQ